MATNNATEVLELVGNGKMTVEEFCKECPVSFTWPSILLTFMVKGKISVPAHELLSQIAIRLLEIVAWLRRTWSRKMLRGGRVLSNNTQTTSYIYGLS